MGCLLGRSIRRRSFYGIWDGLGVPVEVGWDAIGKSGGFKTPGPQTHHERLRCHPIKQARVEARRLWATLSAVAACLDHVVFLGGQAIDNIQ